MDYELKKLYLIILKLIGRVHEYGFNSNREYYIKFKDNHYWTIYLESMEK